MNLNLCGHDIRREEVSDDQGAIKGYRKVSKKVGKLKAGKTCYVRIR